MELDEIDALRASVEMLRGTNDALIDEARRRLASAEPRHIDDVLADEGEVAGTGFVIPGDPPALLAE